ncbi:MAG: restriction endonuclease subunit S [Planctomycetes bacterium]|nr:restriction endonuclease subunit S [Planctomycetota bacterium]
MRVRPAALDAYPLVVAPVKEQRAIVAAIDSHFSRLDAATATLEHVQRNLERYRASVLKAAVEGRLVPTEAELARKEGRSYEPAAVLLKRILAERRRRWEEAELAKLKSKGKAPTDDRWKARYVEPAEPDTAGLPVLPEGWCWATLPMLGEIDRGRSRHRPRNDPRLLGGTYPFIQTGDVRCADGFIRSFTSTYSEFGLAQSRLWPAGTLCITIAANIAETAILGFEACFPDSIVGFVNAERPVLVRFTELFLRTAKAALERFAPATAQKNINLQTLTEVAVPLPPEAEIRRIVDGVEAELERARRVAHDSMRPALGIARLRQSILKWAFEGRLVNAESCAVPSIAVSQS